MIKLAQPRQKKDRNSTIALINIVFLMLIFFLIAGTITPPLDTNVTPVSSQTEQNSELDSWLSLREDGTLYYRGELTSVEKFASVFIQSTKQSETTARLFVDHNANARQLVKLINKLKASGLSSIRIVTQRKPS